MVRPVCASGRSEVAWNQDIPSPDRAERLLRDSAAFLHLPDGDAPACPGKQSGSGASETHPEEGGDVYGVLSLLIVSLFFKQHLSCPSTPHPR